MQAIDSTWVEATNIQIGVLRDGIDSLQSNLNSLQGTTDLLYSIVGTSNESISNQLTAAGILLALVAIIVTIVGVVLGISIERKRRDVERIAAMVDEKKKAIDEISETTRELDRQIHNNLKRLYKDLREEETSAYLDRLILEPGDITNLLELLLSRELSDADFFKVREAFLKMLSARELDEKQDKEPDPTAKEDSEFEEYYVGDQYEKSYLLLLFQHYCYQSIKDDTIRPILVESFSNICQHAFKRDIIKTTIDLCKVLSEEDSTFSKIDVLTAYLKAINMSVFNKLKDLRNILEQNLSPSTLLENAIAQCEKEDVYLKLFGREKPTEMPHNTEIVDK